MGIRAERRWLADALLATVVLAFLTVPGFGAEVPYFVPFLALLFPLLRGRYVGESRLRAIARWLVAPRRRPGGGKAKVARGDFRPLPRGGRLIASSLAKRPPPVPAAL